EIERDKARGILSDDEAQSAKLEISRRLLSVADKTEADLAPTPGSMSEQSRVRLAGVAAGAVTVIAMASYLILGSPGLPGQPHAERAKMDPRNLPVAELIARVEARLQTNPDDARGWDVIAPIYLRQKAYRRAVHAYQRTIQLNGESPRRLAQYAESILGATNGLVNDTVRSTYEKLLKLRPDYHPAKFWLAMRHEQQGQREQAISAYRKMLEDRSLPGQMRTMVRQRLTAMNGARAPNKTNADKAGSNEAGSSEAGSSEAGRAPELSQEARQSMASLTPEQRQQRIRQMVEGLAERLKADGGDLNEWQRLVRAYMVLGDKEKAIAALQSAQAAFASMPGQLEQLAAFAKSLGLKTD
ncbi:MAG: c-type cytochrome biogenesis protein CcmI, partial [Pseudomonadota bacterium]